MLSMARAVLLDVGGTLWSERLAARVDADPRLDQLARLLPELDAVHVLSTLGHWLRQEDGSLAQNTHDLLAQGLQSLGLYSTNLDVLDVRRAMCAPAVPGTSLFPGAIELLSGLRQRRLRTVIASNVQVRGAREYGRDFADLGVAHLVDAIVTSLEVGFRKPHPAFFEVAIQEARCEPGECVMIGNSEANDIEPAIALGIRTIRVAIEEPLPTSSAAHAVVTTLDAAVAIIDNWADKGPRPAAWWESRG
jgi:FMN phosphatase YigB (HAD superfamily)